MKQEDLEGKKVPRLPLLPDRINLIVMDLWNMAFWKILVTTVSLCVKMKIFPDHNGFLSARPLTLHIGEILVKAHFKNNMARDGLESCKCSPSLLYLQVNCIIWIP